MARLGEVTGVFTLVVETVSPSELWDLRKRVLYPHIHDYALMRSGEWEPNAWHIAGKVQKEDGKVSKSVVGATFIQRPHNNTPAWQLREMAADETFQGLGLGAATLKIAARHIAGQSHIRLFWCDVRITAVKFFEKQDWNVVSTPHEIARLGLHQTMTYVY
jgi:GNAT superfamily N-acetyltransferase